jgi:hypothetical protein
MKHDTEHTMKKTLIGGAVAVTAVTAVAALVGVLPDIRRYLRIRRM